MEGNTLTLSISIHYTALALLALLLLLPLLSLYTQNLCMLTLSHANSPSLLYFWLRACVLHMGDLKTNGMETVNIAVQ